MKMFGKELTLEQIKGFVKGHEKDGEIIIPSEWVLELIDKAQETENLKEHYKISEYENKRLLDELRYTAQIEAHRNIEIKRLEEQNRLLLEQLTKVDLLKPTVIQISKDEYSRVIFDPALTNEDIDKEMGGYTGGYSSEPKSRY